MVIKSSFSVILCCSLLASVFFLYEISSRKLMVVPDGNRRSKAAVKRSSSKRASSWAGYNVPPPSTGSVTRHTYNRGKPAVAQCGRRQYNLTSSISACRVCFAFIELFARTTSNQRRPKTNEECRDDATTLKQQSRDNVVAR
ncbi:hypothetical protein E1A91_D13G031000v1 [Gossypium mustelinum]|uniref:Uncharacterized protein n=2 Tax=Gossypium TaxID=3633 RepID=A0A5D2RWT5_GOSMU|nr:hypothetical protein E1A91_D13G031000v1 [Gossypium mustelinum]